MVASKSPEQPARKRGRHPGACDKCHDRKVRCDSSRPRCNQCTRSGYTCSYTREYNQRLLDQEPELMEALDDMEELLGQCFSKYNPVISPSVYAECGMEKTATSRLQYLQQLLERLLQHISSSGQLPASLNTEKDAGAPPRSVSSTQDIEHEQADLRERDNHFTRLADPRPLRFDIRPLHDNYGFPFYANSVLGMLNTRSNLQSIGARISQPDLAEKMITSIETIKEAHEEQKRMLLVRGRIAPSKMDNKFELFCLGEFCKLDTSYLFSIVTPDEANYAFNDTSELSGLIRHCVVLIIVAFMRLLGVRHGFSKQFTEQQLVIAFMQATHNWSLSGMLPQEPALFRALVLYAMVTTWVIPMSQHTQALTLAYSTGLKLGLNSMDPPGNSDDASWTRNVHVWEILRRLDYHQAVCETRPLGVRDYGRPISLQSGLSASCLEMQLQACQRSLYEIYNKCYEKVFSREALGRPHRVILEKIHSLNAELDAWRSSLPDSFSTPSEDGYFYLPTSQNNPSAPISFMLFNLNILFFALKAQLHALPAFVYSFINDVDDSVLQSKQLESVGIASDAAREIFRLSILVSKAFSRLNYPLYHCCLMTANQTLFLRSVMWGPDDQLDEDIRLIHSSMKEKFPTILDELLLLEYKSLVSLSRSRHQQRVSLNVNFSYPSPSLSDSETPSDFVSWVKTDTENVDNISSESCQIL